MSAKKGLGRGFDSLIPTELFDESFDPTSAEDQQVSDLRYIKLSEIKPDPNQPRRHFDESALEELAASIKEHGVLQPIVVTRQTDMYMIVAGERRYRASLQVGLDKIPALVRTLSDQHRLELSLIENIQRRDLNVMETATSYLKLRDQFNLTLDQIGQRVGGKSVSSVSNTLRLLRLPEEVRNHLADGTLREGQARPLIGLEEHVIHRLLPRILKEEWSARKIEQYILEVKQHDTTKASSKKSAVPQMYQTRTTSLTKRFVTPVSIKSTQKGAGQIVIPFKDAADFERLAALLEK